MSQQILLFNKYYTILLYLAMFSQSLSQTNQSGLVKSYMGVDLSNYQCHELKPSPIFSEIPKDQLHYVIDALQKGRKPHTKIGLKRLKTKNIRKTLRLNVSGKPTTENQVSKLNPKSPELICMKTLRAQFRQNFEKNKMAVEQKLQVKVKLSKMIKKKENQKKRRIELIRLTKKYWDQLQPHFRDRMHGYGRCPKISREQIKDYLKSIGIEAKLDPIVEKEQSAQKAQFVGSRRGRGALRQIRAPGRHLPQPMGMIPIMGPPDPFQNLSRPIGMIPPMLMMGLPNPLQNIGKQNIQSTGVQNIQHPQSNPPKLKDEDFPSLLG